MAENSKIAWTTHTFNPWWGCQRVSPGCQHCYAEALDKRVGGGIDPADGIKKTRWGPTAPRIRTSAANWRQPLRWNRAAVALGLRHRVFCASMADVFEDHPSVEQWRAELFSLIEQTPQLDWLLLTKRPENIKRMLPKWRAISAPDAVWPNVWLGTTVEDQQRANERIPHLISVPARVHFLSCEPLLESIDLGLGPHQVGALTLVPPIDWVIIGGESGPGARTFHTDWARDLIEQCNAAGVAPFVKQLGTNAVAAGRDQLALLNMTDHGDIDQFPEDLRVRFDPVTF